MHETPHAFFHLDQPADLSAVATGNIAFQGWAVGKPGQPLTDLRVRQGGQIHPGVLGFLRPDLAAHFQLRNPLPGGFEIRVPLLPGTHTLEFEGCDLRGQWLPLGSVTLKITGENPETRAPAPVLQAHEFARALQLTLSQSVVEPLPEVTARLAASLPQPQVTRYAPAPFHGHLHQPALLEPAGFGRMLVEGWLFHETAEIRRVVATVDLQAWQTLEHGGDLPYVATLFPQHPAAARAHVIGLIDIPAQLPAPLSLRLYAELADGSWHLCHVQRVVPIGGEEAKRPAISFGHFTFIRTVRELRRAFQRHGFVVPLDRNWWIEVRRVFAEFKTRALPVRRPALAETSPASTRGGAPLPDSVTLVTHNLNYEGAPLFLVEYARHLAGQGIKLHVISGSPGPLAAEYQALGADVQVIDVAPLKRAPSAGELRAALDQLASQVELKDTALVVANTLSCWWAVHLARAAGRPALLSIHESTTPARFYFGQQSPALLPVIEETFTIATHISFLTDATRRYYQPLLTRANHSLNAGWIDLRKIDAYLMANPRDALRARLGVDATTRLVVNIGTVCERKGQHIFARAVDLLWRRHPELAASARFVMVGGRHTVFDAALGDLLVTLDRPNLQVVPETGTPLAYYGAADLFVCSSYEESFPRVVLEAMACRVPVVSTDVHGIPEMIRNGLDGVLVPPGDTDRLSEGLARLLGNPAASEAMARSARQRLEENFDSARLLPRHLALACELAAQAR